ncbi:MAG: GlsB/YeaQ/YmgE family stress response membrane protein [Gemmatimonadetes bacterium]|nr:GlsB/YeaQ/YmgE family stress response membrane protein [Gemmatimonadota bacterium]
MLWMILIGLIAGAIAKLIMPGKDPGGIIVTILLGIAGSLVGGMLFGGDAGSTSGLIGSVVGALILLALYRLVVGRRRPHV